MEERKLYWEQPDCGDYSSDFELLCETVEEAKKADLLILSELKECVKRLSSVQQVFPGAGIGDTATDEAIASRFYQLLHSSC